MENINNIIEGIVGELIHREYKVIKTRESATYIPPQILRRWELNGVEYHEEALNTYSRGATETVIYTVEYVPVPCYVVYHSDIGYRWVEKSEEVRNKYSWLIDIAPKDSLFPIWQMKK